MPFAGNDTPPHCKYMSPYVSDSDILLKALKPIKKTPLTGVGWGQIVLKLWKYSSSNSRSKRERVRLRVRVRVRLRAIVIVVVVVQ